MQSNGHQTNRIYGSVVEIYNIYIMLFLIYNGIWQSDISNRNDVCENAVISKSKKILKCSLPFEDYVRILMIDWQSMMCAYIDAWNCSTMGAIYLIYIYLIYGNVD